MTPLSTRVSEYYSSSSLVGVNQSTLAVKLPYTVPSPLNLYHQVVLCRLHCQRSSKGNYSSELNSHILFVTAALLLLLPRYNHWIGFCLLIKTSFPFLEAFLFSLSFLPPYNNFFLFVIYCLQEKYMFLCFMKWH